MNNKQRLSQLNGRCLHSIVRDWDRMVFIADEIKVGIIGGVKEFDGDFYFIEGATILNCNIQKNFSIESDMITITTTNGSIDIECFYDYKISFKYNKRIKYYVIVCDQLSNDEFNISQHLTYLGATAVITHCRYNEQNGWKLEIRRQPVEYDFSSLTEVTGKLME